MAALCFEPDVRPSAGIGVGEAEKKRPAGRFIFNQVGRKGRFCIFWQLLPRPPSMHLSIPGAATVAQAAWYWATLDIAPCLIPSQALRSPVAGAVSPAKVPPHTVPQEFCPLRPPPPTPVKLGLPNTGRLPAVLPTGARLGLSFILAALRGSANIFFGSGVPLNSRVNISETLALLLHVACELRDSPARRHLRNLAAPGA